MLPSDLLIQRRQGETIIPKRLPIQPDNLDLAQGYIDCLEGCLGKTLGEIEQELLVLEGDNPDYRLRRGLAHLLKNHFCTFEIISPIEPQLLRQRVFTQAAHQPTTPIFRNACLEAIAADLTRELNHTILPDEIIKGLYSDLAENRILTQFTTPTPEQLLHRYNLSQVQGIFYKASEIIINAHRNDPGEYKLLFRYLKLFQLMAYIEGDADTGFTITIDGPTSLFKASTRYGLSLAKLIPALLHVSRWSLTANLQLRDYYTKQIKPGRFTLNDRSGLVSHYPPSQTYDSMLEASFVKRWLKTKTDWSLEREVDLIPIPGSVMIPDFRLVHPDGREFLLEIVGYWRPEYLQKKFAQVRKAQRDNLILAISERLNLSKAGVNLDNLPAKVIWFKDKLSPQSVLAVL
ncbi:MAG: DUF790 family protein [Gloeocapsa sp. DLM2.Bin57]|nr:MAG: DUF790 family protein [Gloeocapsa sp. DLM2.Bin57]